MKFFYGTGHYENNNLQIPTEHGGQDKKSFLSLEEYIFETQYYISSNRNIIGRVLDVVGRQASNFYLVTSWMACAKYPTFFDVIPATEMRPSFVR